jgi:hypothetical protein
VTCFLSSIYGDPDLYKDGCSRHHNGVPRVKSHFEPESNDFKFQVIPRVDVRMLPVSKGEGIDSMSLDIDLQYEEVEDDSSQGFLTQRMKSGGDLTWGTPAL